MTKTQKTQQVSPVAKKAANLLLLLQKPPTIPKILSALDAEACIVLHRKLNLTDDDDGRDYQVEILCTFYIGKKRMALLHFVGYSTDYDRILPMSRLRNFRG
jgi:hypothetical protein